MKKTKRRIVLALCLLALAGVSFAVWQIGPRNIVGMIFYDQRREGALVVGSRAPDVTLTKVDGSEATLSEWIGGRPLVLIFGSFT